MNLIQPTLFFRLKKNGEVLKGQYKYLKLHPNHKTLYSGEWNNEKTVPTIEDLEPKVQVRILTPLIRISKSILTPQHFGDILLFNLRTCHF